MGTQSSDDYLKEYLDTNEFKDNNNSQNNNNNNNTKVELGYSHKELEFLSLDVSELPCSNFYPAGTTVMVRPAKVSEIQAYSIVDDTNFYDIFEKVNQIISSCVFLRYPDNTKKPYTHIVDGDRFYLLFVIRELTFQKGNDLYSEVKGVKIPIKRGYFKFHDVDDKIMKFYDKLSGKFIFQTKSGDIEMSPPTMGLQKSFTDFMVKELQSKKELDQSFLKIVPYLFPGRTSVTDEGIRKELIKFSNLDNNTFQFLNQAVEKLTFGISGVKTIDESGQEVHSDEIFPEGASGIFVQSNAFDDFLI